MQRVADKDLIVKYADRSGASHEVMGRVVVGLDAGWASFGMKTGRRDLSLTNIMRRCCIYEEHISVPITKSRGSALRLENDGGS